MTFSMNAIKNNIQPLPEGKHADEKNRSYLDALQKKRIALFLNKIPSKLKKSFKRFIIPVRYALFNRI